MIFLLQLKGDVEDDEAILSIALEEALAVAEGARRAIEGDHLAIADPHRFERMEHVLDLHAIRAYVLHGCSAHLPRDQ